MGSIAVIGGGASGLACAIAAKTANPSAKVIVLEKLDRVGKKILSTGNGRCNLTNLEISPSHYRSCDTATLSEIVGQMPAAFSLDFFSSLGLMYSQEEKGRIYPYSNQASSVLDVLLFALRRLNVELVCSCPVTDLSYKNGSFTVSAEDGKSYHADRVILSSGGNAAGAHLGCDGLGFHLAENFGHSISRTYPCLVPFRCAHEGLGKLRGIRAQARLSLYSEGETLGSSEGEVQFAEYGISGIPAMDLSCLMGAQTDKASREIFIDLFPALDSTALSTLLESRARSFGREPLEVFFTGLINKRLGFAVLKSIGISPLSRPCSSLGEKELTKLSQALKAWRFPVIDTLGWDKAQVTGGGIPLREIDPLTMQSRLRPGLFLTGEILDAVGICGGYNLHWAWSTGILAGRSAVAL